ncbi:monocarboxylate transporter 10 isoform X2 [Aphidius gifuensis]|uniref:monocarboxylate transporter 10 isoform X2 n=1 Tax=Aphidius gifuensis TaxID=684658 RepID=UPI001CDD3BD2|nr:monocarboxylate transporter 10 isoform X2 [Aphidius gifuensis]
MTVTGYVEQTQELNLTIPTNEKKFDMINQQSSTDDTSQDKITINNKNIQDENEPFIDNNDKKLSKTFVDGLKIEIVSNKIVKKKSNDNDDADDNKNNEHNPPDGGVRAWSIMLGSFFINGILFGVINSYSLIYTELTKELIKINETEISWKASLVGSLTIGTTFLLSPVSGILTDKIGIRMTTLIGGALATGGLLLSSMFSSRVEILYLTYGVIYGLGASLAYTPSLVILGHYFKKYIGLVNGIVTAGSSIFTIIMPNIIEYLLHEYNLVITLRSLAFLTSVVMLCAILFKPITPIELPKTPVENSMVKKKSISSAIIDTSIWKRKRYVVWASAIPIALFGYFVPYVHIGKFVELKFSGHSQKLPLMCIGISSGIGRLVFGYIADIPRVDRIMLQQISFVSIGILTMLLPSSPPYWAILLTITLLMGLFDGCFISLLGPIAFDICGKNGATQAIGFLLGMCSIPLTIGAPIAGSIFDHTGSYTLPFALAGIPPLIGAFAMCLIRFFKNDSSDANSTDDTVLNGTRNNDEKEVA